MPDFWTGFSQGFYEPIVWNWQQGQEQKRRSALLAQEYDKRFALERDLANLQAELNRPLREAELKAARLDIRERRGRLTEIDRIRSEELAAQDWFRKTYPGRSLLDIEWERVPPEYAGPLARLREPVIATEQAEAVLKAPSMSVAELANALANRAMLSPESQAILDQQLEAAGISMGSLSGGAEGQRQAGLTPPAPLTEQFRQGAERVVRSIPPEAPVRSWAELFTENVPLYSGKRPGWWERFEGSRFMQDVGERGWLPAIGSAARRQFWTTQEPPISASANTTAPAATEPMFKTVSPAGWGARQIGDALLSFVQGGSPEESKEHLEIAKDVDALMEGGLALDQALHQALRAKGYQPLDPHNAPLRIKIKEILARLPK